MVKIFKGDPKKEQLKAEEMGLTDKVDLRAEARRKSDEKAEDVCVEEGCQEKKAPGQTHVCSKHVRAG